LCCSKPTSGVRKSGVTDRPSDIIFLVILACYGLAMAAFFTLCIVSPNIVAGYYRRQYHRSKLLQKMPFTNTVLRPWFLGYLRVTGVFGVVFLLVVSGVILHDFLK